MGVIGAEPWAVTNHLPVLSQRRDVVGPPAAERRARKQRTLPRWVKPMAEYDPGMASMS